jgi:hypothetical protein
MYADLIEVSTFMGKRRGGRSGNELLVGVSARRMNGSYILVRKADSVTDS